MYISWARSSIMIMLCDNERYSETISNTNIINMHDSNGSVSLQVRPSATALGAWKTARIATPVLFAHVQR